MNVIAVDAKNKRFPLKSSSGGADEVRTSESETFFCPPDFCPRDSLPLPPNNFFVLSILNARAWRSTSTGRR